MQIFVYSGHQGVAELLIRNGADVDVRNFEGYTALFQAVFKGNLQIENHKIDQHFCIEII